MIDLSTIIEAVPGKVSGAPVFKGTRVPVQNLIDYLESGDNLDEFLSDFPTVTREQAVSALECAKEYLVANAHERSS